MPTPVSQPEGSIMQPSPQPPVPDNWHHAPRTNSPWMARYLVAREACDSDDEAARRARVSVPIVVREAARNPDFAALRDQAIARTLTLPPGTGSRLARDSAPSLIQDAIEESRGRSVVPGESPVAPRDRVRNRQLVLEAAGALGQGAQGGVPGISITAAQVSVALIQATPEQLRALAGSLAPGAEPEAPSQGQTPPP